MSTLLMAVVALTSASAGTGLAVLGLQRFLLALQYRAEHDGRWHGRQ
jgi:hypothetical protein